MLHPTPRGERHGQPTGPHTSGRTPLKFKLKVAGDPQHTGLRSMRLSLNRPSHDPGLWSSIFITARNQKCPAGSLTAFPVLSVHVSSRPPHRPDS